MTDHILYVDDDPNVLAACKRSIGRKLNITTASSGAEGLELIANKGPFAVLLSDMRMPKMDGLELICAAQKVAPEMVCLMLTGNADQETAINAVNKGHIFRFLTKPCQQEVLHDALTSAIKQHRLVTAEKELLQKTLTGSVKALADVLELVNPKAFARSGRIKPIVKAIAHEMKLKNTWQYEIAALLSQIGCIVLPPETLDKIFCSRRLTTREEEMYSSHPQNGRKLIEHIPRLGPCARMIEGQLDRYDQSEPPDLAQADGAITLGAQILHTAIDLDIHLAQGLGRNAAIEKMTERDGEYNPDILKLLGRLTIQGVNDAMSGVIKKVSVWGLKVGMYVNEDVTTSAGALLVVKGNEVTNPLIARLKNFSSGVGIKEPIEVLVPQSQLADAA